MSPDLARFLATRTRVVGLGLIVLAVLAALVPRGWAESVTFTLTVLAALVLFLNIYFTGWVAGYEPGWSKGYEDGTEDAAPGEGAK